MILSEKQIAQMRRDFIGDESTPTQLVDALDTIAALKNALDTDVTMAVAGAYLAATEKAVYAVDRCEGFSDSLDGPYTVLKDSAINNIRAALILTPADAQAALAAHDAEKDRKLKDWVNCWAIEWSVPEADEDTSVEVVLQRIWDKGYAVWEERNKILQSNAEKDATIARQQAELAAAMESLRWAYHYASTDDEMTTGEQEDFSDHKEQARKILFPKVEQL